MYDYEKINPKRMARKFVNTTVFILSSDALQTSPNTEMSDLLKNANI